MHIDHTTIRTAYLEETKDFLINVFELSTGTRPAVIAANIPGYWLYWKDAPLIHLIKSSYYHSSSANTSAEAIDHTAFYLEDHDAFKERLTRLKIPFSLMNLPDIGERRIFIQTPTNILLEAVFRS